MHLQGENTKFVNENFGITFKIETYETIINIEYCPPSHRGVVRLSETGRGGNGEPAYRRGDRNPKRDKPPSEISQLSATNPVLEAKVNDFTTAVDAFDDALKASSTNPATATATATDDARDASWRGANNYVTAMCAHPTAEVAANAAEAKSLFDKYGDPTKLAQTEESGVLHNLLQDLEALDSSKRTALNLDVWITDLKTKENAFLAAAAQRTEADAARQVGIVKETRTAAEAAYRSLVDTVNALAMINGDAEYATFIDHVNAMIERRRSRAGFDSRLKI